MAISLTNRKNTKITNANGIIALDHHGSRTCEVNLAAKTVRIALCGYDTVTTRGKINAFLIKCQVPYHLVRKAGSTYISHSNGSAICFHEIYSRDVNTLPY